VNRKANNISKVVEVRTVLVLLHNACADTKVAEPLILLPVGGIIGEKRSQRLDNLFFIDALLVDAIRPVT